MRNILPNDTILGRDLAHRKQGEMLILALLSVRVCVCEQQVVLSSSLS